METVRRKQLRRGFEETAPSDRLSLRTRQARSIA
jgi:hypothetical protein